MVQVIYPIHMQGSLLPNFDRHFWGFRRSFPGLSGAYPPATPRRPLSNPWETWSLTIRNIAFKRIKLLIRFNIITLACYGKFNVNWVFNFKSRRYQRKKTC